MKISINIKLLLVFSLLACSYAKTYAPHEAILSLSLGYPTQSLSNENLPPASLFEARKKEFQALQQNLRKLQDDKVDKIAQLNNLKSSLLKSKEALHGSIDIVFRQEAEELIDERLEAITETIECWKAIEANLEDHLSFINKNKDMLDERQVESFDKERYFLEDLYKLEERISQINDEKEAIKRKINSLEISKAEDESNLDFLRKEEANIKKKLTEKPQQEVTLGHQHSQTNKAKLLSLALENITTKINLAEIKIEQKIKAQLSYLTRAVNFMRYRLENILQPGLQKINLHLQVDRKDIDKMQALLEANKQAIVIEKDGLTKEINQKKEFKLELSKKIEELKRKKRNTEQDFAQAEDDQLQEFKFKTMDDELKINLGKNMLIQTEQEISYLSLKKDLLTLEFDNKSFELYRAKVVHALIQDNLEEIIKKTNELKDVIIPAQQKNLETINAKIYESENFIQECNTTRKNEIKTQREEVLRYKNSLFRSRKDAFLEAMAIVEKAESCLDIAIKISNQFRSEAQTLIKNKKLLIDKLDTLRRFAETNIGLRDLWSRSTAAISMKNLAQAYQDAHSFGIRFFWESKEKLNPVHIFKQSWQFCSENGLGILSLFIIFILIFLSLRIALRALKDYVNQQLLNQAQGDSEPKMYSLLSSALNIAHEKFLYIALWIFIHTGIKYNFNIYDFAFSDIDNYYITLFYLCSIPVFLLVGSGFIRYFKIFNHKISYFFFLEHNSSKNEILLKLIAYSSAITYPLHQALISYGNLYNNSELLAVIFAAYTLIVEVVILLYIDKEDIMKLIPKKGSLFSWIHQSLDQFYYPVFLFFMGLLIIYNPYIGYSNLAWYLAFVVPITTGLIILGYTAHQHITSWLFDMSLQEAHEENNENNEEKFTHARIIYGSLVILTFLTITTSILFIVLKLWNVEYSLHLIWKKLAYEWTLSTSETTKFGLVECLVLCGFASSGYALWSIVDKMLFNKIFDLFNVEPGLQNTISRMVQYIMVLIAIIMGFVAVKLTALISWTLGALVLGIGLGIKDQLADFFAGVLILLERQIEVGHYVETENNRGTVHKISLRSTIIRTVKNHFVVIPNRLLISKSLINWGAGRVAVGFELSFTIEYQHDPENIVNMVKNVIHNHPLVLRIPTIVVRLEDFSENGMQFLARAFISARRVREQWQIAADIRTDLYKIFQAHNINLPYAQHVVHMAKDKNQNNHKQKIAIKLHSEPDLDNADTL